MDLDVKLWLYRQGITDEILKKIVEIAGTLPRALLMIMQSIRHQKTQTFKRPFEPQPQVQPPQKLPKNRGVWNLSDFREVESIVVNAKDEFMQSFMQTSNPSQLEPPATESTSSMQTSNPPRLEPSTTESTSSMEKKEYDYNSGVTLLSGEETVNLSKIEEIQSALLDVHSNREKESISDDISLADLIPISREAISLGILNGSKKQRITTGWKRNEIRTAWTDENSSFLEREYDYKVPPEPTSNQSTRWIRANYCPINFEPDDDLGDGIV